MSNSITQDMAYRQSLMKYAQKYGVSRASRKYNKSRSYIYFWRSRWDGSAESLACQSRRPHSHPNQHTKEELKLIRDMRRRNPQLGLVWKMGNVSNGERFFRQTRQFFAGILCVLQGKLPQYGGKRPDIWAYRHFSNKT